MLVNLNPQMSNVSFQKLTVDRESMTKTQQNLYDKFVREELNTDVDDEPFSNLVHRLDEYGVNIKVKPLGDKAVEIYSEKNGKKLANCEVTPETFVRQITDRIAEFKETCVRLMKSEKASAVGELAKEKGISAKEKAALQAFINDFTQD